MARRDDVLLLTSSPMPVGLWDALFAFQAQRQIHRNSAHSAICLLSANALPGTRNTYYQWRYVRGNCTEIAQETEQEQHTFWVKMYREVRSQSTF